MGNQLFIVKLKPNKFKGLFYFFYNTENSVIIITGASSGIG